MNNKKYKIVYCTPALYMAGGVERVLTNKANYFADIYGYDITIIITEGANKPLFFPLSPKIRIINLNIGFEELWSCSFFTKIIVYLRKQRKYKMLLKKELFRIRPDITISLLRREINFINDIKDGSKKIRELHVNRANYRNFNYLSSNIVKTIFSRFWMKSLTSKLRKLDKLVVLTHKDMQAWVELNNVVVIPNPLSFNSAIVSKQTKKRVISVGRYCHEKGFDDLLRAWARVQHACPDWKLVIYGDGNRSQYEVMLSELGIDSHRCELNGPVSDIQLEYANSSMAVCSSRFEGFGLFILEAMACGLPVVSFDCPWGPSSIITNLEDGVLVENGNVSKLADNMVLLMKNEDNRLRMSKNAIKNVRRYSIDIIANNWKCLFDSL